MKYFNWAIGICLSILSLIGKLFLNIYVNGLNLGFQRKGIVMGIPTLMDTITPILGQKPAIFHLKASERVPGLVEFTR